MSNGISLKGIVAPNGTVHHFDHEYLENNPPIPTGDATLTQEGSFADAAATGNAISAVVGNLNEVFDDLYSEVYSPEFRVISGGLTSTGGNYDNHPERARTQYVPIESGKTYVFRLNDEDYEIYGQWLYSGTTTSSATRSLTRSDSRNIRFTAGETENYLRVAFRKVADPTAEITEENRTTIHDAIQIFTNALDALESAISTTDEKTDWLTNKVVSQPYSGEPRFLIGSIATSTGKTASRVGRMRMTYTKIIPNCTYRFEIVNTTYVAMYVHFYSGNRETTWLGNPYHASDDHRVFTTPEDCNYIRIVFYDSTDTEREIDDSDVEALTAAFHLYQLLGETAFKERTGEFIRFTVKNNHRWTSNDSTTTDDAESSEETDHLCILTLPESYSSYGEKTPLIMYCHGASCGITNTTWYGNSTGEGAGHDFMAMIRRFTSEGYAVFDVDNTRHVSNGFNDWGSLPLMSAYVKAWEYIKKNYNVEDDLYLLSASMGTPAALNMMKWYKGKIKTAMLLAPRPLGVKGRWDDTYSEIADSRIKQFLVAWGFAGDEILTDDTYVVPTKEEVFTAAVDAKYRGFYHYENMVTINGTNYIFEKYPPVKVMVGLGDPSFLPEVRQYFAALQNFGNYVNYREVAGKTHGAICTLVGGELLDEGVAWFARFRNVPEADESEEEPTS